MSGREAARLANLAAVLGDALAAWAARDDTRAQPAVRESANEAMAVADDMLTVLHRIRSRLAAEMRQSDDATGARVDAMLAEREAADDGN